MDWFVSLKSLCCSIASSHSTAGGLPTGKHLECSSLCVEEVLSPNLPGGTKEDHERSQP
jgi:hypothetical protein